jgi:hypothetical protein
VFLMSKKKIPSETLIESVDVKIIQMPSSAGLDFL